MLLMGFCGGVGLGGSCLRIISLGFLDHLRVLDGLCLDSMADLILFIGFILFGWYSTMIFHSCHVPDYGHQLYYNSYTHQVQSPFQYIIIKLYISQTIKKSIMHHTKSPRIIRTPIFQNMLFQFQFTIHFLPT
jgi:hypothetical protein